MRRVFLYAALIALLAGSGCATLSQFMALQHVDFSIDGIEGVRLAGVDVTRVASFTDLSLGDAARLVSTVGSGSLPLSMDIQVLAENPADNSADARLTRFDWVLLLDDRETVRGALDQEVVLPRGAPTIVPVPVELDLVDFFQGDAPALFDLALSFTGLGGERRDLTLVASPSVETPLGPITYDRPIRLVRRDEGN